MTEANKEVTLERTFDAPRETVWKYWTDRDLVQQWWGPDFVTSPTCEWDAKEGGNIYIVMLAGAELGPMAGQEWPMRGKFLEVVAPEKLVFLANAIMNDKPILEHRATVTLTEQDGKTHMTVHIVVTMVTPEAEMALQGMEMGWNQQMDKLVAAVKG